MTLHAALLMNDPASFNPHTDSTIMLGLEAQQRGYALHYFQPHQLSLHHDKHVTAQGARPITFFNDTSHFFDREPAVDLPLSRVDVTLLRHDPPYNIGYLNPTYLLEKVGCYVTNNPAAIRNFPEKISPFLFHDYMPDTVITRSAEVIQEFAGQHAAIILKPLYGFGGRAVFKTGKDEVNFHAIIEQLLSAGDDPIVVQQFLPEVKDKDARILLVDGEAKAAIGRLPSEGEIRANFRVGGTAAQMELSSRQQEICDRVGTWLKEQDIIFCGLDLIGDYLTEINITCPTGLRAAESLYGLNVASDIWDAIEKRL